MTASKPVAYRIPWEMDIIGPEEFAALLDPPVTPLTINRYHSVGSVPKARIRRSGHPLWSIKFDIMPWASKTGRKLRRIEVVMAELEELSARKLGGPRNDLRLLE